MHGFCGCGRRYLTREEKIEMLKEYKTSLENEAKAVSEELTV